MRPIDKNSAEHYIWNNVCDGWHLVKNENLSVIEERVPAGAKETRHLHTVARQFFYILSGEAVMEISGERVRLSAGQGIEIAPGTYHQFLNESSDEVKFLVVSQPTAKGDRIEYP